MAGLIVRTLIIALGLGLAELILSGVTIHGTGTLFGAALLLGLVNAVVRPIVVLFLLVINAGMFALVAAMLDDFQVAGFFSALLGAVIVSITSMFASWYIGPKGSYEVMIVNRRG